MSQSSNEKYWNPYFAGVALGVVLVLCFIITGHGLGASGAFTSLIASGVNATSVEQMNAFYRE